ncbi:MAG: hypothetical protein JNN04_13125 [Cyclobacteriaceae bacterium]|nr:hypothetical protein [Cyclobacteriaceae bacterium]
MRILLFIHLLLVVIPVYSQNKEHVASSDFFTITGAVEQEQVVRISDLQKLPSTTLEDVVITNHLGEPRGTAKGLKGVKVKDVLATAAIRSESPKMLSEFYLTFVATDGYLVVFSWNELFNSPAGDHCYLITERDGKALAEMPDRILVITTTDFRTGRRHIKGLEKIVVARAAR